MRELEINKQEIWYATCTGFVDTVDPATGYKTGEKTKSYNTPVKMSINVSPARGNAEREVFGINDNYTRTMTTSDMDCPIAEDTILWVGVATTAPHNYVVTRVAKSLNDIVYAIREVTLSG